MKTTNLKIMAALILLCTLCVQAAETHLPSRPKNQDKDTLKTTVRQSRQMPEKSIIDEVIWVVGDQAILKSDVEALRMQAEAEGKKWNGNPDCVIPEQLAIQKLFLAQAEIDSISVTEAEISQGVEQQINYWIQLIGSKEKLEQYRNQSITQIRQSMHDDFKNSQLINKMKEKIVENVQVTPGIVRRYVESLPQDSLPMIPTKVEVEIITRNPVIEQKEIDRVKKQLREYGERAVKGETSFATLARLYSEDVASARQGGELGYTGRGTLDPAFAGVAFNLTEPGKVSKVVETEFGFHIIQLIDKRGDKINCRHILLRPEVSQAAIDSAYMRLDSIAADIQSKKLTFEQAASYFSQDKDTRNNHGLMAYNDMENRTLTSRYRMRDLPTEVARSIEGLKVGEISKPFVMINAKGKKVAAIVKLKNKYEEHKATIREDYQTLKNLVLEKEREKTLHDWVVNKIKQTYVRMNDRYKNCQFEYQGWVK